MTTVESSSSAKLPLSVAELICAPSPKVESTRPLKWKYSAMMLAFQAPPEAVTRPVMRYGKIPGRTTVFPTLYGTEMEDGGGLSQIGGDGDGACDHVEEHVPLRAEKHEQN